MCILCIGIGVSFSLIYRLSNAHGVDLLSFVVYLPRTMKEYRDVVVKLFARGERPGDIFRRLKSHGVKRDFIYYTIRRYRETGSTKDRVKSGRPRSARTPAAIKVVRERIRRNMNRSIRKTAADLNVSIRTAHNIMTKDLGYKPYKKRKVHGLTEATTKKRLDRSKLILSRHAGQEFVFSDEKLFVLQQPHNAQNDRLWAPTLASIPPSQINIPRFQSAASVMVWGAVSRRGKLPLVFIEKNVKINAAYYKTEVLEKVVAPALRGLYGNDHYVFQQDGAPAHTANIVQAWCRENLTDFLDKTLWPPSSPDLNPLDFYVWSYMLAKQSEHRVSTMDQFKKLISKIWDEMPMDQVRAACDSFEKRLKLVVKHKGRVLPANMS